MDIFVLPSLWEPLANAILEAHSACVPVVTTNVDGSPEIIVSGKTGLLVKPGRSEELANAILYLLRNRDEAKEMAKRAKERVKEQFKIEDMAEKTGKVYIELCRRNAGVNVA
jgi:glycosyltransferase involved in cell wall biosynthesis